jgi:diacylglycerol O-acyltransferase
VERLSGLDAMFLYLETPSAHLHVAAVFVLDPSSAPAGFGFEQVRGIVARRLPLAPPFRRRLLEVPLGLHHPVWVEDPHFDLDFHVRRASLPRPGGAQELAELVAHLVALPLDRRRPLWELYLVEGLEGDRYALVTKVHHAAIDGVSGAELTAALLDLAPDGAREEVADPWAPERLPTDVELFAQALGSLARQPLAAVRAARRVVEAALHVSERNREAGVEPPPAPFSAPRTSLNQSITPHRRVAFSRASLAELKAVKRHFGCTVNDVVLAVCAGALRRYLLAGGELPDVPLVALVPVSVRTGDEKAGMGNRLSAMLVALPTEVEDPVARLGAIAEGTRRAKEQERLIGAETLTDWTEFAFPALIGRAARLTSSMRVFDRVRPAFNVTISNVPGPRFSLYLAGARLEAVYPLGPIVDGVGLNMTVMSYRDDVFFGLLGCRDVVSRIGELPGAIEASLAELLGAGPGAAPRPRAGRR